MPGTGIVTNVADDLISSKDKGEQKWSLLLHLQIKLKVLLCLCKTQSIT
jgi:hypothetical protein